jgi:hypothetical protein
MKLIVATLVVLFAAGVVDVAAQQGAQTQGAAVVSADNPPLWGTNIRLVRELRIGVPDGAEEYMFSGADRLAAAVTPANGHIFVLDVGTSTVREFDSAGKYVRTFGHRGSGPGEIGRSGTIAVTGNSLLVYDAANRRLNIYPLGAGEVKHVAAPSGPVMVDSAGVTILPLPRRDGPRQVALRIDTNTLQRDTIALPWSFPPLARVEIVTRSSASGAVAVRQAPVPYVPDVLWRYSRFGEFVGGNNATFSIERVRLNGEVLRSVRSVPRVPVAQEFRAAFTAEFTAAARGASEVTRGPDVPSHKPAYQNLFVDHDGRVWVRRSLPSERPTGARSVFDWTEPPPIYDVISRDGRFLGTIQPPAEFQLLYVAGDHVWGAQRGDLDVPYVVRYRIVR